MKRETHETLGDYLDGVLPEAERRELEERLAGDPALAAELARLRRLLADAAALPREVEPGRDLWPGIERRIRSGRVEKADFRPVRQALVGVAAAAALVAVALATGVLRIAPPGAETARAPERATPEAAAALAAFDELDREYAAASREVLERLERGELDAETLRVLRRNLEILDGAVREIRRALDGAPADPRLQHLLTAEYQRRSAVLRQAAELAEPI